MGKHKKSKAKKKVPALMAPEPLNMEPLDPEQTVQAAIGSTDPTAMCVGFVAVAEWLEADGTLSMSVINSEMSPWQMYGLLSFARDAASRPEDSFIEIEDED